MARPVLWPEAMPFDSLRRHLRKLATSGGLLLAGARMAPGCCPPMNEPIGSDATIDPRGTLGGLVSACRADDAACTKLCAAIFFESMVPMNTAIVACVLRDRTPSASDVHVEYVVQEECSAGRRPPGLVAPAPVEGDPVGQWLAAAAHLEAASVPAFVLLARDLVRHGAPPVLIRAALAAADDEVRHAAVMSGLARAYGVTPPPVELTATAVRDLPALALDNAIEGCVREAFAARCAAHQAAAARDPALRAALAAIAVDDARLAALAVALDRWLSSRIGAATRRACALGGADAFEQAWVATDLPPRGADRLGWPSPRRARALLAALPA